MMIKKEEFNVDIKLLIHSHPSMTHFLWMNIHSSVTVNILVIQFRKIIERI